MTGFKRLGLKRRQMIKRRTDFQRVYHKGKVFTSYYFVLYVFRDTSGKLANKVAFAAGKRLGNAPIRNRIKRLMREAYRHNQHRIKKDFSLLVVGREPLKRANGKEIIAKLFALCNKAGIIA